MKNNKRQGIWINENIFNLNDIDFVSKGILAEIEQLSKMENGCYISNNSLSELFGISVRSVQNKLSSLVKLDYIKIKYKITSSKNTLRFITTTDKLSNRGVKNLHRGGEKNDIKGVKNLHTNNTFPLKGEMNTVKSQTKIPNKGILLRKQKNGLIDGNVIFMLEKKGFDEKQSYLIYSKMIEDPGLDSIQEMKELIINVSKKDIIELYE